MRNGHPRRLEFYRTQNGREPFISIRDTKTRTRIQARLEYLEIGNFGDYRSVGEGVFELRLQFGSGYRIYFGEVDDTVVLLLCGGDKSLQTRDIRRAKTYWRTYKETQHRPTH